MEIIAKMRAVEDEQEELEVPKKSKSQKKREVAAIYGFAKSLQKLSLKHIRRLELSEEIEGALLEALSIKSYSARERQFKYLGSLIKNSGEYEEIVLRVKNVNHL